MTQVVARIATDYGNVTLTGAAPLLGELFVTDEGVEIEVVGLDPLRFELAPPVEEDWGE